MTDSTNSNEYVYGNSQPPVQDYEVQDNKRELRSVDDKTGKVGKPDSDSAGSVGS